MSYEDDLIYRDHKPPIDVLPITRSVALEVAGAAQTAGMPLVRIIGATTWADHNSLRCIDFVGNRILQQWVVNYMIVNQDRLGLELMINQHRMYRTYPHGHVRDSRGNLVVVSSAADTWTAYGPQANGGYIGTNNPHTDHVHVQVYDRPYTPPKALVPGYWHLIADNVNGRNAPSTTSGLVLFTRSRPFTLNAVAQITSGGRAWLKSDHGTYYAKDYFAPGKAS